MAKKKQTKSKTETYQIGNEGCSCGGTCKSFKKRGEPKTMQHVINSPSGKKCSGVSWQHCWCSRGSQVFIQKSYHPVAVTTGEVSEDHE